MPNVCTGMQCRRACVRLGTATKRRAVRRFGTVRSSSCSCRSWAGAVLAGAWGRTRRGRAAALLAAFGLMLAEDDEAENRGPRLYPAERFTPPGGIQARACSCCAENA